MIERFWKDKSKKMIDPGLFSTKAEELAKKICDESKDDRTNSPAQIRKFYDEVIRYDSRLKETAEGRIDEEFQMMLPYIKMLNAKAAYAMARNELVSKGFKDFIDHSLRLVNDKDDFNAFAGLFEAFVGYYKYYFEMKKKENSGGRR